MVTRMAILSAQIVLPSRSSFDQSDSFVSRLTQHLDYAINLSDSERPCSTACWIFHACDDALSPLLSAGGGVQPCEWGQRELGMDEPAGGCKSLGAALISLGQCWDAITQAMPSVRKPPEGVAQVRTAAVGLRSSFKHMPPLSSALNNGESVIAVPHD